jgi:predicted transcriptional regulator
MASPRLQVIVEEPLRQRLEALAAADNRSVSSYIRLALANHLRAVDRAQQQQLQPLGDFYRTL